MTSQSKEQAVIQAALALLVRIDNITTHDFSCGGEKIEREALRKALNELIIQPVIGQP